MADLIIGGSTYLRVNTVLFRQTDGETATFVEKAISDVSSHSPTGYFVSATLGVTGIVATIGSALIENIPTPTVELKITV